MKEEYPYRALLKKYLEGKCTEEEKSRIRLWFDSFDNESTSEEVSFDKTAFIQTLQHRIEKSDVIPLTTKNRKASKLIRFSAAASLILGLGISILLYRQQLAPTKAQSLAAIIPATSAENDNDILPGTHFATLSSTKGVQNLDQDSILILSESAEKSVTHESMSLETPKSATYQILLEDGTKVWLNASSKLIFPNKFNTDVRQVSLEGEAYFEVAKDPNRPFRIQSRGTAIEVLGTSFNLKAYDEAVSTSLIEGSVKINNGKQEALLTPGQEASTQKDKIVITESDLQERLAWKRGEFYFDGHNIKTVLQQISIWYNISFADDILFTENYSFKGTINRNSKLSEVIKILSFATDQRLTIKGRKVCLLK